MRTQVGIVGAGSAGLTLPHLLQMRGIGSVVIDQRGHQDIEETIRAGGPERQVAELGAGTRSIAGSTLLAENHVGLPLS